MFEPFKSFFLKRLVIYCNGVARLLSVVFRCYPPFGIVCMWDKIYLIRKMSLGEIYIWRIIIKYRVWASNIQKVLFIFPVFLWYGCMYILNCIEGLFSLISDNNSNKIFFIIIITGQFWQFRRKDTAQEKK